MGAYSHSQGVELVRREVADFISRRDGFKVCKEKNKLFVAQVFILVMEQGDPELIFLTDGASPGVQAW